MVTDDPELRSEVLSLLEQFDDSAAFEPKVIEEGPDLHTEPQDWVGLEVGAYTLRREIGQGGMSRVFLADRTDREYESQVAVKLLREGLLTEDLVLRFRRERQILANLDHPNIARLLDGGTAAFGGTYLVMEYIDGPSVTEFCHERKLGLDERLALFLQICAAVQYAHRNLILHLDLKPGNVLVGRDSTPKLLDFGIARLLEGARFDAVGDPTIGPLRPMTPRYASPEQLRGRATSTASDVYSLGVILYELLTGRVPFELEGVIRRSGADLSNDPDATRPSVSVRRGQKQSSDSLDVATDMRLSAHQLSRRLDGDLDRILLQALKPDPEERYASVEALANDISRHRAGLPIAAAGASFIYRARKFVRRHPWPVGLGATLAALTLLSTLLLAISNQRIERTRIRVQQERDNAIQLSEFLVDVFQLADPRRNPKSAATVAGVLEQGAQNAMRELSDHPKAQTKFLQTIGEVELSHGRFDRAAEDLQAALEIHERANPTNEIRTAELLTGLSQAMVGLGKLGEADELARRALEIRSTILGPDDLSVADSLNKMGELRRWHGDFEEAASLFAQALQIRRTKLGDSDPAVAESLQSSANLDRQLGNYDSANTQYTEALEILRAARGDTHPETVEATTSLSVIRLQLGDYETAENLQRRVVQVLEGQYGKRHPLVAATINRLARTLEIQGRLEEAEAAYREALALRRELLGERHYATAISMSALATLVDHRGRPKESEELFRTVLSISRESFPGGTFGISYPLIGLGCHHVERGEHEAALPMFEEALALRRTSFPAHHPQIAEAEELVDRVRATLSGSRPMEYSKSKFSTAISEYTTRTVCKSL